MEFDSLPHVLWLLFADSSGQPWRNTYNSSGHCAAAVVTGPNVWGVDAAWVVVEALAVVEAIRVGTSPGREFR